MTAPDPNKIQRYRDGKYELELQYLKGVADSVGYVILDADLMNRIASAYCDQHLELNWYRKEEQRRNAEIKANRLKARKEKGKK
jgi:hypothetical protein